MTSRSDLLERALLAEERCEALEVRIADLETRLRGALNADPTTATRALSWIGRAEEAEKLLTSLLKRIGQRSVDTSEFPAGWVSQAQAQMKAVEVLNRDFGGFTHPTDDVYWTLTWDERGRRSVVKDDDDWALPKITKEK